MTCWTGADGPAAWEELQRQYAAAQVALLPYTAECERLARPPGRARGRMFPSAPDAVAAAVEGERAARPLELFAGPPL